jgi:hypothetical protein
MVTLLDNLSRKSFLGRGALVACVLATGCRGESLSAPNVPVALVLSVAEISFSSLRDTAVLRVEARDEAGRALAIDSVRWSSSDTTVVSVRSGRVVAVGNGSATVSAAYRELSVSAQAVVAQVPVALRLDRDSMLLSAIEDTQSLAVQLTDARGVAVAGRRVAWTVTDGQIATVDSSGRVRAVRDGQTKVIARSVDLADSAVVRVRQAVRTIETPAPTLFGLPGDTLEIQFVAKDANGFVVPQPSVSLLVSDTGVASRASNNALIARGWGSATLTIRADIVEARVQVTVGLEWTRLPQRTGSMVWSVWVDSTDRIHASHENGLITSYGISGDRTTATDCPYGLWSILPLTVSTAVGVGWRGCSLSFRSGVWSPTEPPAAGTSDIFDIWGNSRSDLWIAAIYGVWRFDGTQWTKQVLPAEVPSIPWFYTVWGTSPTNVWAGARDGVLLRWDGSNWSTVPAGTFSLIRKIWGTRPDSVYVASDSIRLWNGSNWRTLQRVILNPGGSVTSANNGFFLASNGIWFLRGTNLQRVPLGPGQVEDVNAVHFNSRVGLIAGHMDGNLWIGRLRRP